MSNASGMNLMLIYLTDKQAAPHSLDFSYLLFPTLPVYGRAHYPLRIINLIAHRWAASVAKALPPRDCQEGNQSSQGEARTVNQDCAVLCACQLPAARKDGETEVLISNPLLCFSRNTLKCNGTFYLTERQAQPVMSQLRTTDSRLSLSLRRA